VAAAAVVLGAWGGFINPADSGGGAIASALKSEMYSIPFMHIGPALLALVVANIMFAAMNRKENSDDPSAESEVPAKEELNKGTGRIRGIIAVLPFLFLIPVEFLARYLHWSIDVQIRLLICLLASSVAAFVIVLRDSGKGAKKTFPIAKMFLGGMWKGFAEVVVLIFAAKVFITPFLYIIHTYRADVVNSMLPVVSVPIAFIASAMIGSGEALASPLIFLVVPNVKGALFSPGAIASMLWLATEMGRNVSPISAATLTCAKSTMPKEIDGTTVSRHVFWPLLVGFVVGCLALYVVFKVFK
jgi:C4-dicarboxylate transporter